MIPNLFVLKRNPETCPCPIALDYLDRLFISADGSRLPGVKASHANDKYILGGSPPQRVGFV